MQEDSALPRTYFHRTNRLAVLLGVDVEDLVRIMNIGRRTLFDCRSTDLKASAKSWAKLEAAEERAVQQSAEKGKSAESHGFAKDTKGFPDKIISPAAQAAENVVREDEPLHYAKQAPAPLGVTMEHRMERLEVVLSRIATAMEKLVEKMP